MTKYVMFYQVGVKANDGNGAVSVSVTPRKSLCDGKFHEVTGRTSCIKNIQERESHVDSCASSVIVVSQSPKKGTHSN